MSNFLVFFQILNKHVHSGSCLVMVGRLQATACAGTAQSNRDGMVIMD
jgi:hypothetical protein